MGLLSDIFPYRMPWTNIMGFRLPMAGTKYHRYPIYCVDSCLPARSMFTINFQVNACINVGFASASSCCYTRESRESRHISYFNVTHATCAASRGLRVSNVHFCICILCVEVIDLHDTRVKLASTLYRQLTCIVS